MGGVLFVGRWKDYEGSLGRGYLGRGYLRKNPSKQPQEVSSP